MTSSLGCQCCTLARNWFANDSVLGISKTTERKKQEHQKQRNNRILYTKKAFFYYKQNSRSSDPYFNVLFIFFSCWKTSIQSCNMFDNICVILVLLLFFTMTNVTMCFFHSE